jgi:hypothetical protein
MPRNAGSSHRGPCRSLGRPCSDVAATTDPILELADRPVCQGHHPGDDRRPVTPFRDHRADRGGEAEGPQHLVGVGEEFGAALGHDRAVHQHHPVAGAGGARQVVAGHQQCPVFRGQSAEQLVQQDARAGGQRAGHQDRCRRPPESSPTGRHRSAVSPVSSSASSTAARSVAPGGAASPSVCWCTYPMR